MIYFPVFLDLRDRPVLVVGGGRVARRKVAALLRCGARVTVVAPEFDASLRRMPGVAVRRRRFRAEDVRGAAFVVGAADDPAANALASRAARARRIPVNVVDAPALCDAILPAVLRRGPVTFAVSTGGAGPVLARRLREDLARVYGPGLARLARAVAALRRRTRTAAPTPAARARMLRRLVGPDLLPALRRNGSGRAFQSLVSRLSSLVGSDRRKPMTSHGVLPRKGLETRDKGRETRDQRLREATP